MSSSESDSENNEVDEQELDVHDKLKNLLIARNKIMRRKPIELPGPIVENVVEISDVLGNDSTSEIKPSQKFMEKKRHFSKFHNDVRELIQSSGNSVIGVLLKNFI